METWYFLQSGKCDPALNMAMDEALLESVAELKHPVLRFYGWTEGAASFGYFQRYSDVARWTQLRPLIRRPTGGGLVPHDRDWTYSLVFPPGHSWYELRAEESYRGAHEWISGAFDQLRIPTELATCQASELPGQCFAGAEKFDLLLQGRKIAGAAQRRNKQGLLIQGSVQSHPHGLSRSLWEEAMLKVGTEKFGAEWMEYHPAEELRGRAEELRVDKYSQERFNRRR